MRGGGFTTRAIKPVTGMQWKTIHCGRDSTHTQILQLVSTIPVRLLPAWNRGSTIYASLQMLAIMISPLRCNSRTCLVSCDSSCPALYIPRTLRDGCPKTVGVDRRDRGTDPARSMHDNNFNRLDLVS